MKQSYKLFMLLTTFLVNHSTFGASGLTESAVEDSDVSILSSLAYLEDLKSVALTDDQEKADVVLNLDPFLTPSIISFVQRQKEEEQTQIFEFLISQIENPFLTKNSLKMAVDVLLAWPDRNKLYERVNPFIESFSGDPILNHSLLAKTSLLLHSTAPEIQQKMVDFVKTQQENVFEKMNGFRSIQNNNRQLYMLYKINLEMQNKASFLDLSFDKQQDFIQKFTNKAGSLASEEDISSFCLQYFEYPRAKQYFENLILSGTMSNDRSLFDESLKYFEKIKATINLALHEETTFYQDLKVSLFCCLLSSSEEETKQEDKHFLNNGSLDINIYISHAEDLGIL